MSSSSKQRAIMHRRGGAEPHLVKVIEGPLHAHTAIQGPGLSRRYNIKSSQLLQTELNQKFIIVRPTTSVNATALTGGGLNTFRMNRDPMVMIEEFFLEIDITNTDGANVGRITDVFNMIDRCEWMINSSKMVQEVYGYEMYQDYIQFNDVDTRLNQQAALNLNANTFASFADIPAGATVKYFVPLTCFVDQIGGLWGGHLMKDLELRLYLNPDAIETNPAAGTLNVTDMQLRVLVQELTDDEMNAQVQMSSVTRDYKFLWYSRQSFDETLSPNSSITHDLQSLHGLAGYLNFTVTATGATGAGIYGYVDIGPGTTIELRDNNNASLQYGFRKNVQFQRSFVYPKQFNSSYAQIRYVNSHVHTADAPALVKAGQLLNYETYSENKNQINFDGTIAAGSYTTRYTLRSIAILSFAPNGNVDIQRS